MRLPCGHMLRSYLLIYYLLKRTSQRFYISLFPRLCCPSAYRSVTRQYAAPISDRVKPAISVPCKELAYILISADAGVELNGVAVEIRE